MGNVRMRADARQESKGFPLADDGDYWVRCTQIKDGRTSQQAKNPNKQKVDLFFDILEDDGTKVGSCWHTVTFLEEGNKGHGIWLHVNHALGMPYDGEVDFDTEDYVGKESRVRIYTDEYKNKKKNKIAEFYTEDGDQPEDPNQQQQQAPPKEETRRPAPAASRPPAQTRKPAETQDADLEEVPF